MSEPVQQNPGSPLGVCVLPPHAPNAPRPVRHAEYVHELLGHAGLCYDTVPLEALPKALHSLRILATIGEHPLSEDLRVQLASWVAQGGTWLSVAGLCGMEDLLGASYRKPDYVLWGGALRVLGEGYLDPGSSQHPVLQDLPRPLHFFNGLAVTPDGAEVLATAQDAHGRPADLPALLERRVGVGRCLLLTPDLTGSIVHVQQGNAVLRDGSPAPDGTGPVSDGVLKTDDGQVLDWLLDREPVPDVAGLSAFLQPVADQWRDLLLRAIFYLAAEQGVSLPLLWFYPEGRIALGHLSHDTDGNDPAKARLLLDALRDAEAPATWCVILPSYDPPLLRDIRDAGHELATHFDAMTPGCPWGEAHFDRQFRELRELFGEQPVTNKNHYLRWEGDTELWEWCAARGIRMDQSKGASKTGEAGFNFGTCHPYRPVIPDGRVLPILELPTPTQDLHVFAPEELVAPLLQAVTRHYGILHLLFHPAHIDKPNVADSLVRAVRSGRDAGLEWWTGRQIAEWEEARRGARWSAYRSVSESATVTLTAEVDIAGATVLWLVSRAGEFSPAADAVPNREGEAPSEPAVHAPGPCGSDGASPSRGEHAGCVERWGFLFHSQVLDLPANEPVLIHANARRDASPA